jgi:hypothetical protein
VTPVPMRWTVVCPRDVIVGRGEAEWTIEHVTRYGVRARHGDREHNRAIRAGEVATVLLPDDEHAALTLLRDALGARIERREIGT